MPQTPEQQAAMAAAFREYLSVHPALELSGSLKDEISRALVGVVADLVPAKAEATTYPEIDHAQFSGNGVLGGLIYEWAGDDCDANARRVDEHIKSLMRGHVDAARAQATA